MALPPVLHFVQQSVRHSAVVGAVLPSGTRLAQAMVEPVFRNRPGPLRILEVGAGTGPITTALVEGLAPGDHLDVVELNPAFCELLRERFRDNLVQPFIHAVSILDFQPDAPYDHIISGLPLANFSADMVAAIYQRYFELLTPGGTFVMFRYLFLRKVIDVFASRRHRQRIRKVMEIERSLQPLQVETRNVLLNVPPAQVIVRQRPAGWLPGPAPQFALLSPDSSV